MMIRSLEAAQKAYDDEKVNAAKNIAAKPQEANEIAQGLLVAEATLTAWGTWERFVTNLETHAVGQNFSDEYIYMLKFAELAELGLRNPDDEWSGRGNDARRVKHEAKREVYAWILRRLQTEAGL
jgi:hypothetical protein